MLHQAGRQLRGGRAVPDLRHVRRHCYRSAELFLSEALLLQLATTRCRLARSHEACGSSSSTALILESI